MNKIHLGSDFDDFLQDEDLLLNTQLLAIKRVIAFQATRLMEDKNISKSELSYCLNISRSALDRLLDPTNESVTLQTLERAARALGLRLQIGIV
jgi:DNA-binding Xre family transcriptional regulator